MQLKDFFVILPRKRHIEEREPKVFQDYRKLTHSLES